MEAVRDSFLIQHVNKPTHFRANQTPNVLDLVFTNEQAMIDTVRHEAPLGKSHHQTLFFNLKCYTQKKLMNASRFNFAKGDYDKLRECVASTNISDTIRDLDIHQAWTTVKDTVMLALKKCIPKVKIGNEKSRPLWMNNELTSKMKKKKQAYKKYLQTREGTDYLHYTRARNQVKSSCRAAVKSHEKNIARNVKQNPKAFFSYAKSKLKTRDGIADLKDGQKKVSSDAGKANLLNKFFSSVFTEEDLSNIPTCECASTDSKLCEIDITPAKVCKRLAALNPSKSSGPDGFHPRILKE